MWSYVSGLSYSSSMLIKHGFNIPDLEACLSPQSWLEAAFLVKLFFTCVTIYGWCIECYCFVTPCHDLGTLACLDRFFQACLVVTRSRFGSSQQSERNERVLKFINDQKDICTESFSEVFSVWYFEKLSQTKGIEGLLDRWETVAGMSSWTKSLAQIMSVQVGKIALTSLQTSEIVWVSFLRDSSHFSPRACFSVLGSIKNGLKSS